MVSFHLLALTLASFGAGETVLYDFSADWCGPCQRMLPLVRQLEHAGYPVRTVNVDREPALKNRFRVGPIPCFVMVVNGRVVDRAEGLQSMSRLKQMLAKANLTGTAAAPAGAARRESAPRSPRRSRPAPSAAALPEQTLAATGLPRFNRSPAVGLPVVSASQPLADREPSQRGAGSDLDRRLLEASARLNVSDPDGSSSGTGVIIDYCDGMALILTCGHIFRLSQGSGRITVDLFCAGHPRGLPGQLIGYDLKRDVGLVMARPSVPVIPARVAPPDLQPHKGDTVISVGCDNGADPTVKHSVITSVNRYGGPPNLQVAGQPVSGRSGGGLFNANGLVIGVCNGADPADNEGYFAALESVYAELDRYKLGHVYQQSAATNAALATAAPPRMQDRMPDRMPRASSSSVSNSAAPGAAAAPVASNQLSPRKRDIIGALGSQQAEVVCVIRSPGFPNAEPRVIALDQASPEFLKWLAVERRARKRGI